MSRKLNLYNVPVDLGKQEGIDAERRLEMERAESQTKLAVTRAIKKATVSPSQVMTGQGILDMTAEAALEGALQGPQTDSDRLATLRKERDQLVALRADAPANRDVASMDRKISDLSSQIAIQTELAKPVFQRTR